MGGCDRTLEQKFAAKRRIAVGAMNRARLESLDSIAPAWPEMREFDSPWEWLRWKKTGWRKPSSPNWDTKDY